ncbi:MAG: SPL family radical SAM protein, partial [Candidatus Methanomethylophilaceae archaeon]
MSPSGLPGVDYALNPYAGCSHGCVYCYAPEVTHSEWKGWRIPGVRENIPFRLAREVGTVSGTVCIGTSTDPYQAAEERFELTRRCLEILSRTDLRVSVMTKSGLVTRDMDLLSGADRSVSVTVTNTDVSVCRRTEPGAPPPSERLDAIRTMVDAGLKVICLAGPVLSTLEGRESELAEAIIGTGVRSVCMDGLNGRPDLNARLERMGIRGSASAF